MRRIIIAGIIALNISILFTSCAKKVDVKPGTIYYKGAFDDLKDIGSAD